MTLSVPTNHLRDAIADALVTTLAGCTLSVGSGHYTAGAPVTPLPSETALQTPVLTGIPVTVQRDGNTFILQATLAGTDSPVTITEAGVILSTGQAIILEAFPPKTIQAPLTHSFKYHLFPGGD